MLLNWLRRACLHGGNWDPKLVKTGLSSSSYMFFREHMFFFLWIISLDFVRHRFRQLEISFCLINNIWIYIYIYIYEFGIYDKKEEVWLKKEEVWWIYLLYIYIYINNGSIMHELETYKKSKQAFSINILQMEKALSWEIDDFSKRNSWIKSDNFSSGGCEW